MLAETGDTAADRPTHRKKALAVAGLRRGGGLFYIQKVNNCSLTMLDNDGKAAGTSVRTVLFTAPN